MIHPRFEGGAKSHEYMHPKIENWIITDDGRLSTPQRERELQAQHAKEIAERKKSELTIDDLWRISERYGVVIDVEHVDADGFVEGIRVEGDPELDEWLHYIEYAGWDYQDGLKRERLADLRRNLPRRGSPTETQITRLADELGLEMHTDDEGNMWTDDYDFNKLVISVCYNWQDEMFRHMPWSQQKKYIKEAYEWLNHSEIDDAYRWYLSHMIAQELGISPTISGKTGNPIGEFGKFMNAFNDAYELQHKKGLRPLYSDMFTEMRSWQAELRNQKDVAKRTRNTVARAKRRQQKRYNEMNIFQKFKHKMNEAARYDLDGSYNEKWDRVYYDEDGYPHYQNIFGDMT